MFGKRLKHLRDKRGMTQKEVADILGLTPKAVGFYESEERQPSQETLIKLSEIFDVSVDYLLGKTTRLKSIENGIHTQDEFTTPEEAISFLLSQEVIMGFGGFDVEKLSDEDKIQFANELLGQLKLLSYKYKK